MANRISLRDDKLKIIAFLDIENDGKKTLRDDKLAILGFYDPTTDTTRDKKLKIIGKGDLLTTLL
jgi:hypothetical protein